MFDSPPSDSSHDHHHVAAAASSDFLSSPDFPSSFTYSVSLSFLRLPEMALQQVVASQQGVAAMVLDLLLPWALLVAAEAAHSLMQLQNQ